MFGCKAAFGGLGNVVGEMFVQELQTPPIDASELVLVETSVSYMKGYSSSGTHLEFGRQRRLARTALIGINGLGGQHTFQPLK